MSRSVGGIGGLQPAMAAEGVAIVAGFPETARAQAAALFWDAFRGKLAPILGPEAEAARFLNAVLSPTHAFSALDSDGRLLGIAGYSCAEGRFVAAGLRDLARVYGWFGGLWRGLLLLSLERAEVDGLLLMDGIFVSPEARGRGVGSALLDRIAEEARARNLSGVRLDVIDTNPRARALYERKGFVPQKTQGMGPLKWVFGFSRSTAMVKPV